MEDLLSHMGWTDEIQRRAREHMKQIRTKVEQESRVLDQAKDKAERDLQDHISKVTNNMAVIQGRVSELERQLAESKVSS